MPNKHTFSIKPIKELLEEELPSPEIRQIKSSEFKSIYNNYGFGDKPLWLDPFVNHCGHLYASITNDLNPEYEADYHMDALDFLQMFRDNDVDGVLYDPPYSARQVAECYKGVGVNVTSEMTRSDFYTKHKKEIARIIRPGGKVICFGWNSGGIGKKLGFELTRILLVPHGGTHNDTIVTVEVKNG
jgi:hypothetical protein